MANHKSIKEASITAGEGNDGADLKSLLNPESRLSHSYTQNRRRREAPVDTVKTDAKKDEETQQFPDAQAVSTISYTVFT